MKKDNKIIYQGVSVIEIGKCGIDAEAHEHLTGGEQIRYYIPRNYSNADIERYSKLCSYVEDYILFYSNTTKNKHGQVPWIWRKHCIEGSEGHKVVSELQLVLDNLGSKVRYHIKGQNNLAEMYSIFSAETPVFGVNGFESYMNTSTRRETYDIVNGVTSYDETIKKLNLETGLNKGMMNKLLGLEEYASEKTKRRVYVCGQAKTHCVKSSLIDLMEYAKGKGIESGQIVLLSDMTSPICGAPNNIVAKTGEMGYTVLPEGAVDK
jgi:nicotinamidase-related amidase